MKHKLVYGICIMILLSLCSCGSENGLGSMESENALITESSHENESAEEGERSTAVTENSHNETMEPIQEQKRSA